MIALTQITHTEIFAFIAVPVFKLLIRKENILSEISLRLFFCMEWFLLYIIPSNKKGTRTALMKFIYRVHFYFE